MSDIWRLLDGCLKDIWWVSGHSVQSSWSQDRIHKFLYQNFLDQKIIWTKNVFGHNFCPALTECTVCGESPDHERIVQSAQYMCTHSSHEQCPQHT